MKGQMGALAKKAAVKMFSMVLPKDEHLLGVWFASTAPAPSTSQPRSEMRIAMNEWIEAYVKSQAPRRERPDTKPRPTEVRSQRGGPLRQFGRRPAEQCRARRHYGCSNSPLR